MSRDTVGYVLVAPQCPASSFHIADAADAVDDAHVMPVAGAQLGQEFGMGAACGFALKVFPVAHLHRCRGVIVGYAALLNEHTRHAVRGGSHDVAVIEAQAIEAHVQFTVPVLLPRAASQAQVPLAEGACAVACTAHHIGHRVLLRPDDGARVAGCHIGARVAKRVFTREDTVSAGRAGAGASVHVGEAYTLTCHAVYVGGLHTGGSIA